MYMTVHDVRPDATLPWVALWAQESNLGEVRTGTNGCQHLLWALLERLGSKRRLGASALK